jgi:ribosomal protein L11 methyltransferase
MEWIESVILTTPDGVEMVSGVLINAGITGFQIEDNEEMKKFIAENAKNWDYVDDELLQKPAGDTAVIFYVPKDSYGSETLIDIKNRLAALKPEDYDIGLGKLTLETKNVDDEGWLDHWKKYFKPFKVGQNIVVKPEWEDYIPEPSDIVFNINPGHVFGTGLHQSTKMCIAALEKNVRQGDKIADLGCGSGILSIISLILGGGYAFACDIESSAQNVAYENAALNGISQESGCYEVLIANILTDEVLQERLSGMQFDIVVANIVADIIIALSPLAARFIKKDGMFIVSGIVKERLQEVQKAMTESGFEITETTTMDEWVSCTAKYMGQPL